MYGTTPTSQKVRPIAFVLDDVGVLGTPVDLSIRPEDLTRNEPTRSVVHQTLGRQDVIGWVDNFGEGLPTLTIAGHTGWRSPDGKAVDGMGKFEDLNQLVVHDYHAAKQVAIDTGIDPGLVKLIFVDTLDGFAYSVVPMQFTLRRSKSRPLLYQYNINLQAIATSIDAAVPVAPTTGSVGAGLNSLNGAINTFNSTIPLLSAAVLTSVLGPFASTLGSFVGAAAGVFSKVLSTVTNIKNLATSAANTLIGVASSLAQVGRNVFRAVNAVLTLPDFVKSLLGRVAAAFHEVVCIFANSLKPRKVYEQYAGLYGASNCSSTTGGSPPSPFANQNVFNLIAPVSTAPIIGSTAASSMTALKSMDTVLAPLTFGEIQRHVANISAGVAA